MEKNLKLTSEIISSLTETKKEILRCISNEKLDKELKKKMFKHLKTIDESLMEELEDCFSRIIRNVTEDEQD
ncbi:hypothetical protein [Metabacillus fastidiosus]|uniref:hypothetical protein n=1 Tax=Metabacillus fastidiosus TaxID=1458 RepID=UPI002E1D5A96|nr:hypothetical protein [Metabacillus fastidiosus]